MEGRKTVPIGGVLMPARILVTSNGDWEIFKPGAARILLITDDALEFLQLGENTEHLEEEDILDEWEIYWEV